jgi:hypothetical protein
MDYGGRRPGHLRRVRLSREIFEECVHCRCIDTCIRDLIFNLVCFIPDSSSVGADSTESYSEFVIGL